MNVNDVLNKALDLLGIKDVTVTPTGEDESLARLVNALGVVYLQLVTEYAPIEREVSITVSGGTWDAGSLSEPLFDVARVTDGKGRRVKYRLRGRTLLMEDGDYILRYYALPSAYPAIGSTIEVAPQVTLTLLARGVAAEYALESLMYEESLLHERKYKEGLMKVLSPHAEKRIACGRWI